MSITTQIGRRQSWCVAILTAMAFWPVWRWYALRTVDGSDEPWGVLALVVALGVAIARRRPAHALSRRSVTVLACLVLFYAALFPFVPMLVLAMIAMLACGCVVTGAWPASRLGLSWLSLLMLSLPIMATLQFYAGFPMRWVTAWGTCECLNLLGLAVDREALSLVFQGERILIDVPCSGVRMLWVGAFLASVLACALRLRSRDAVVLWGLALSLVLVGNVWRAVCIFLDKTHILAQPAWMHAGVGIGIFALIGWGVMLAAFRMERSAAPCSD